MFWIQAFLSQLNVDAAGCSILSVLILLMSIVLLSWEFISINVCGFRRRAFWKSMSDNILKAMPCCFNIRATDKWPICFEIAPQSALKFDVEQGHGGYSDWFGFCTQETKIAEYHIVVREKWFFQLKCYWWNQSSLLISSPEPFCPVMLVQAQVRRNLFGYGRFYH